MRLTWIGHATVRLEVGGVRLLTDPVLRGRLAHLRRHGAAVAPDAAAGVDAVLLSHQHLDHFDVPSLRRVDRAATVIAPHGATRRVEKLGFANVVGIAAGEATEVRGVRIEAVPATHDGRRHPLDEDAEALGFVIAASPSVYFAGDTDVFPEMDGLAGDLGVALLPIWGWGPSIGPGHMGPAEAARAAAMLHPRLVVPIHWGTLFPVGLKRWRGAALIDPARAFVRHLAEVAPDVEVRVLAPGESLVTPGG